MNNNQFCENCRFFDYYRCRRHAPIAKPDDRSAHWPWVYEKFWCGDWEAVTDYRGVKQPVSV